jgi:hypothetical protein
LSTWWFGFNRVQHHGEYVPYTSEDELFGEDWLKCFATKILDAKYEKTYVAEVVGGLTHINVHQNTDLL